MNVSFRYLHKLQNFHHLEVQLNIFHFLTQYKIFAVVTAFYVIYRSDYFLSEFVSLKN